VSYRIIDPKGGRTCFGCGGKKGFYAEYCRSCKKERGLYPKPNLGKTGPDHTAWRGGCRYDKDGYLRTYAPDHPWPRGSGYVQEHVRVMELHIGRRIGPDEVVHHRDHDRLNNELSNLEVLPRGKHSAQHRAEDTHLRQRDAHGRFA
jgi:ribosomal protein L40E